MKKYLIVFLILINTSYAQEVKTLKMGDLAPFDGVLFSYKKELELRQQKLDYDRALELNGLYKEKIDIQQQRIKDRDEELKLLSEKAKNNDSFLKIVGAFMLGSVITTGIAYGVSKSIR